MSGYCDISPEFYEDHRRKARKAHKCCECHREISVGEEYVHCAGKIDGDFFTYDQCIACWTFARKINLEIIGECMVPFGCVDDSMRNPSDYFFEVYDEQLIADLRDEWSRTKSGVAA